MHGLTRYILRQSLGTTLFVTIALSAAIWLTQSLRLVDLIVNRGLSAELFFYLGILILPRFIDIVLPIGIFIAVLFTYNKLTAESEIVVMRAAGMSQFGLAKPAANPYGDGSWVKCRDDGALPYDPAKARQLIAEYGKPVQFKMIVTATPRGRSRCSST